MSNLKIHSLFTILIIVYIFSFELSYAAETNDSNTSTVTPVTTKEVSKDDALKTEPLKAEPTKKEIELPKVIFSGDFRYRLQNETLEPKEKRQSQRIQAKLQAIAEVQDDLKIGLRLMTGSSANSGNQTLGDEKSPGMPRRNFGLDQAYFDYQPFEILHLYGGKTPQVYYFTGKNQLILDRDISPEGMALKLDIPITDHFMIFSRAGFSILRDNYDSTFNEDLTDNQLNAGQLGLKWKYDHIEFNIGYGSFSYIGLKNTAPGTIATGLAPSAGANGNTLDSDGNFPQNFDLIENFADIKYKMNDVELSVYYEFVKNQNINTMNEAKSYGFAISYKNLGMQWAQQNIDKDAVMALYTDSDFAAGQSASSGTIYSVNYKFNKKVQMQYTVFKNKNNLDTVAMNYDRNHLDLLIIF